MKYSISTYMFRVRGESNCVNLESENPRDAWKETRDYFNRKDLILFERQERSTYGFCGEISVQYHVPIHYGFNDVDLPAALKRSGRKTLPLKLTDITNLKI